jgi:hypothetical protein
MFARIYDELGKVFMLLSKVVVKIIRSNKNLNALAIFSDIFQN